MSLVKCAECGAEISDKATACVKCGAPVKVSAPIASQAPPASTGRRGTIAGMSPVVIFGGGFIVLCIAGALYGNLFGPGASESAAAAKRCRVDLKCWGKENMPKAIAYCQEDIERLATHSVKWTDSGTFDRKFSRVEWLDKQAGSLTYIGDKVEFQNGFGAYTPVVYSCDIGDLDKDAPTVLGVKILHEGRLSP